MIWGIRGNGRNIYSIYSNIILNHDCKRKETWRDITRDYSQERSNVEIWCSKFWWLECKSRKSRNTWSNRHIWPWSTKWSRAKANRVVPRKCTGHSKHPLPMTQEKTLYMDITRWSILKSIHYILCSQRWRSSIQWAKARLWADYGSYHELLIAKFRLKLKKVWKTTRPFKYDLNQIPYDYTLKVRNRFKRLDLLGRVPE